MVKRHRPSEFALLRNFRKMTGVIIDSLLGPINCLISRRNCLFKELVVNEKKIAIFVRHGSYSNYESSLVVLLEKNGYKVIEVENITNPPLISPHSRILPRKNKGFDLGAFRDVIRYSTQIEELLFINSSMEWDLLKLDKIIKKIEVSKTNNTVTFLTDSNQGSYHGQSYFIHFIASYEEFNKFREFLVKSIKNWTIKRFAVTFGEKEISKYFLQNKIIKFKVLYRYRDVKQLYVKMPSFQKEPWIESLIEQGVELNSTQHLWPALNSLGFPGYKKSLININPARLKKLPTKILNEL
jgi:hypothetical protein